MPELPDVLTYVRCLDQRITGQAVRKLRIVSPFVLRTFDPPPEAVEGQPVTAVGRLGKRLIFTFPNDLHLVIHLMIAGRLRWSDKPNEKPQAKVGLASLGFDHGTLHLIEASTQKRAAIHIIQGPAALAPFTRPGLNTLTCSPADFAQRLRSENHTLKRALTDPDLFDGIGNTYSDEILHHARLSPLQWTSRLTDEQCARLHDSAKHVLQHWIDQLAQQFATRFPTPRDITAFRPDFAAHGKFGAPCPVCGTKIQRIRYAERETNYCPRCQTDGKLLADRSLSRLLKGDWPKTIDALEG